jgi:hypothetical protein
MKPSAEATAVSRPNRLLMALAAIWMVASLAVGGMVTADLRADGADPASITRLDGTPTTATRP